MFISWNWLSRHVELDGLDPKTVGEELTLRVAELDGIVEIGAGLEALRTVTIEHVEPVEGATKLSKVTVRDGDTVHTLVCGAPNVRDAVGQVAVHAPPGCVLPNGQAIGLATIRGVESAGMLASEKELGLSDDHGGILLFDGAGGSAHVEAGQSFPDAVPVHDWIFEVDNKAITHRPDLWGHRGIAREISILTDRSMKALDLDVEFGSQHTVSATVEAPDLCPRYMCTHLTGVTVEPSPQWLQWLLKATGVRPISNVVDLTNFVMMDLGNPLHAFDARFVADHRIVVRRAEEGEVIRTLDGQDRICDAEMLLICDGEKPVALAGVMGGETSEIRDDTTEVILESANFLAGSVRRTSTRHHLRSESSARFEKALDPELSEVAAKQFCKLMVELIDGCQLVSPLVDVAAPKAADLWISLDPDLVSARLGLEIPLSQIRSVLGRLGFDVQDQSSGLLRVKVPTWRATKDVAIAEDLIEEIGRLHGYLNIPPKAPVVTVQPPRLPYYKLQGRRVRQFLSYGCGMHEVMSYAFTLRPLLERLGADIGGRVELANTISSDMDRMRRYLLPNLFNFAEKNARFRDEYALYETGRVFIPVEGELPDQPNMVGFVDVRQSTDPETQFRTLRGIVDGLLADLHAPPVEIVRPTVEQIGMRVWMHPARSALILLDGVEIGYFGLIHPRARKVLNLKHPASFAELNLDVVMAATSPEVKYSPLARFPEIGFDVSFEVDEAVTAGSLETAIRGGLDTDWLRAATLFGNYHLDDGKKSVSFHLAFRADDRSLTDDEVHGCVKTMIATVESSLGATLRGG